MANSGLQVCMTNIAVANDTTVTDMKVSNEYYSLYIIVIIIIISIFM